MLMILLVFFSIRLLLDQLGPEYSEQLMKKAAKKMEGLEHIALFLRR